MQQRLAGTAPSRPARAPLASGRPLLRQLSPARVGAGFGRRNGWRLATAALSALVLLVTGLGHGLFKDLADGLARSNVIAGGGGDGPLNILLLGVDSRTDAQGNPLPRQALAELNSGPVDVLNSDTIILLHVPADGNRAVAISIPRDSYVDIPGYRRDKINAAYPATKALKAENMAEQGITDRPRIELESATEGRTVLVKTVEKLTGLKIDHFAEVNLLGFSNLTKAIGGVEVCLNAAVKESYSGANFPAGRQTISGGAALAFVRQRYELPDGDLSRIRRQQVFLAAVADKVLTAGTLTNPGKLGELVDVAKQSVVIDSRWDIFAFAQQVSALSVGKIDFVTIPTDGTESNSRGSVLLVDRSKVQRFVERVTGEQQETTTEVSRGPVVPPASIVVDVRNSSGVTGLAAQVSGQLSTVGYGPGVAENAGSRGTSVVRYAGTDDTAARQVAEVLGGMPVERDSTVPAGHVRAYVGLDYQRGALNVPSEPPPPGAPSVSAAPPPVTSAGVPCVD